MRVADPPCSPTRRRQIVRGLLACALSHDFPIPMEMHHAQQEYVMLIAVLQLPASIPPYCTTHVGAGGFVVNRSGQVLVVADRRPDRPDNFWKLPVWERGRRTPWRR